ncbi:hypothetical protein [Streptomyces sp. NPDC005898]|uniref:hypothetical protein n=1 Tax=Streptomyces sp. NPDC005898 TaxID=3157082 RepID=UPI0033F826DD
MTVRWGPGAVALVATAAAAVVLVLVGYGSGAGLGTGSGGSVPAYAREPGVPRVKTERDHRELPLEKEEFSARDRGRIARAQSYEVRRCMRSFGFDDFPLEPGLGPLMAESYSATMTMVAMPSYGMLDLRQARRSGYGFDPERTEAELKRILPTGRAPTEREDGVLHGTASERVVNGREVPAGGCSAEGARRLVRGVTDVDRMWTYVAGRQEKLDKVVAEDERVRRAFRDWSRCVAGKGFRTYETPMAAFRDKEWRRGRDDGNTGRTSRELGTAVADVTCKRELNTAGVWWAVSEEVQRADLRRNKSRYAVVRRDQQRVRDTVREVLGAKSR